MDEVGTSVSIDLILNNLSDFNPQISIHFGAMLDGELYFALVTVFDTSGAPTDVNFILPYSDAEINAIIVFDGASYVVYVNGAEVGSATPALPSIDTINFITITQQAGGITSLPMYVSKIDITDCELAP